MEVLCELEKGAVVDVGASWQILGSRGHSPGDRTAGLNSGNRHLVAGNCGW